VRTHTFIAATFLSAAAAVTSVSAEDGPNLLSNGGFDSGTTTWSTFGNGFIDNTITHEFSLFSLKMYGCFCSDYNGNGAISEATIPCTPGEIYRLTGQAYNPSWDSIAGTGNWVGIKSNLEIQTIKSSASPRRD
jgi:hypothetical protein